MEEKTLFCRTGELISSTVYNRAIELYNGWDEHVRDIWQEIEEFDRSDFYESDGSPSIDKIVESVGEEFMWPKGHKWPEDVIGVPGIDCTEEEAGCYDEMTDKEVDGFVNKGIERFINEKQKRKC